MKLTLPYIRKQTIRLAYSILLCTGGLSLMQAQNYDFGDAPASYENNKDGTALPAKHLPVTGFRLGASIDTEAAPNSVAVSADNNGANGDGADEDAINPSASQIRRGVPYTLSVPVTNTTGTKYLYGWIDFNNNGRFEAGEAATVVNVTAAGSSTQTLTWTNTQTGTIVSGTDKLYMRLRFSDRLLTDFTGASGGTTLDERSIGNGAISAANAADHATIAGGEVEDYQIEVVNTFDYGDAPASYENDKDGNALPALHAPLTGFTMGFLIDVEAAPNSVAAGADNNETNGDGTDEDGIATLASVSRGVAYTLPVSVNIPSTMAGTKYLYGWLDLNGDGRFQSGEAATATTTATGSTTMNLTWSISDTTSIPSGTSSIYLRTRLSSVSLTDFTGASGGTTIDERSIGNGATSAGNAANDPEIGFGEVEDYRLPVDYYDFGDAPVSYDTNNAGTFVPARQILTAGNSIGTLIDNEPAAQNVAAGADNNGTNGDGTDEDGIASFPLITKVAGFSISVPMTSTASSYAIAWVDFNNDGKFQASEAAYTTETGITTGYIGKSAGTSTITFWFRAAQVALIPSGVDQLYARIRFTRTLGGDNASTTGIDERSIADAATTGVYTAPAIGEVEDYRLPICNANIGQQVYLDETVLTN